MSSNPFAAYLENTVLSASPVKLVYLAYEGAVEAVVEARAHLKEKRIHERSRAITRAQLIISELQTSLDFQQGGTISAELARLYGYMQRRLLEANFKQIEEPLADVQGLLETLNDAWREVAANDNPAAAAAAASSSPVNSSPASSPGWTSTTDPAAAAPAANFTYTPCGSAYAPVDTPAYSSAPAAPFAYTPSGSSAYTPVDTPAYSSAPAAPFAYTPSGSSAYTPADTPADGWAGTSSGYGRSESAYTRSDYTL